MGFAELQERAERMISSKLSTDEAASVLYDIAIRAADMYVGCAKESIPGFRSEFASWFPVRRDMVNGKQIGKPEHRLVERDQQRYYLWLHLCNLIETENPHRIGCAHTDFVEVSCDSFAPVIVKADGTSKQVKGLLRSAYEQDPSKWRQTAARYASILSNLAKRVNESDRSKHNYVGDTLGSAVGRQADSNTPILGRQSGKVATMDEYDWLYTPTPEDRELFKSVIAFVHTNPDMFTNVGKSIDADFSTQAIRAWEPQPGRIWEDEELKKRPAIPLNERFGYALDVVIENGISTDVLAESDRRKLAERRILLFWLLVDPDRNVPRRADDGLITEFQKLKNIPEGDLPDFFTPTADDELNIDEGGRLSMGAGRFIPVVREALDVVARTNQVEEIKRDRISKTPGEDDTSAKLQNDALRMMKRSKVPMLQKHDMDAWKLYYLIGMKQKDVALKISDQFGVNCDQGQVSRMIKRANLYIKATGDTQLAAVARKTKSAVSVDPSKLDMGLRRDSRAPHRREKARQDARNS